MTDFKLVNITDSVIEDISSSLTLPVMQGATNNTYQNFPTNTSNTSQIQFNIQIPSTSTVVNRHFLCESTMRLKIDFAQGIYTSPGQVVFQYGEKNALQAFPLNSLINTLASNINNANVSINMRENMAILLKMCKYEELAKYNSLCPSLVDSFYYNYADGLGSNNNVLGNYANGSYDKKYFPRGCFPVTMYANDGTTKIPDYQVLTVALPIGEGEPATYAPQYPYIYLEFTTIEPLLFLSPYITGNANNQAGFLGLNNLTITMNMGAANRVMSNASFVTFGGVARQTVSDVQLSSIGTTKMLLNFLTIPPTGFAKLEPKNLVNYTSYQPYGFTYANNINPDESKAIQFNNVQINQIPSKILICVRKSQNDMTTYDGNTFLAIQKISINFANKSGLLSSATAQQLYNMSIRNGLEMSFYEFSGEGMSSVGLGVSKVSTLGSILVIDPAIDLGLDAQYSDMSTGQYNITFEITVKNQTDEPIRNPTITMLCANSGIFMTENGSSSFVTGPLNQEMVLETKSQPAIVDKQTYENEIVGGSIENTNSIHKFMKQRFINHNQHEQKLENPSEGESIPTGSGMAGGGMHRRRLHRHMK